MAAFIGIVKTAPVNIDYHLIYAQQIMQQRQWERGNTLKIYAMSPFKILWDFSASLSESALINFG